MLICRKTLQSIGLVGAVALSGVAAMHAAPAQAIEIEDIVIFATNSIEVERDGSVTGSVVVNNASAGPTLNPGDVELLVDQGGSIDGDVKADTADLRKNSSVSGDVQYNELLAASGSSQGSLTTPLVFPVVELPDFKSAVITDTAEDIAIGENGTATITPGDYGDITVDQGGSLVLDGAGVYHIRSIVEVSSGGGQCGSADPAGPGAACRSLVYDPETEIRILNRFDLGKNAYIGNPSDPSGADVIFFVAGANATPNELPVVFHTGKDSTVFASVYAPNGTVIVDQDSTLNGTLLGKDVSVAKNGSLVLNSFFAFRRPPVVINHDPVADSTSAMTDGAGAITIVLTGSDPDGDSLTFSTASLTTGSGTCGTCTGPSAGSLSNLTAIVPDKIETPDDGIGNDDSICDAAEDAAGGCVQPPTVSATVDYTPNDGSNASDEFQFQVDDGNGGTAIATVFVNPPPETPEFTAGNVDALTFRNTPVEIGLPAGTTGVAGAGCAGCAAPSNGTLSGFSATPPAVTYTPGLNFTGVDTFEFEACDPAAPTNCDIGVVTVTVVPPLGEASAITAANLPVLVSLPKFTVDVAGGSGLCAPADEEHPSNQDCAAPANGTLSDFTAIPPVVIYTPGDVSEGVPFTGVDTFEFCSSGCAVTGPGTATITVVPADEVAVDQSLSVLAGDTVVITLQSQVAEFACFTISSGPTNGSLVAITGATASFEYTAPLESESDSFTFAVGHFAGPLTSDCDATTFDGASVNITVLNSIPPTPNCELTPEECGSNRGS